MPIAEGETLSTSFPTSLSGREDLNRPRHIHARLQAEAGQLVLEATVNESDRLVARTRGRELMLDDVNRTTVVAAMRRLPRQAKILHDTKRVGL